MLAAAVTQCGHRTAGLSFAFGLGAGRGALRARPDLGRAFQSGLVGPDGRRSLQGVRAAEHISRCLGAIAAGAVLYVIATGKPVPTASRSRRHRFGEHSPAAIR